jgi:hypothetical protein
MIIEEMEKAQKRATQLVDEIEHPSFSERLQRLNLPTLKYR